MELDYSARMTSRGGPQVVLKGLMNVSVGSQLASSRHGQPARLTIFATRTPVGVLRNLWNGGACWKMSVAWLELARCADGGERSRSGRGLERDPKGRRPF